MPYHADTMRQQHLNRVAADPEIGCHAFRHTYRANLSESGLPLERDCHTVQVFVMHLRRFSGLSQCVGFVDEPSRMVNEFARAFLRKCTPQAPNDAGDSSFLSWQSTWGEGYLQIDQNLQTKPRSRDERPRFDGILCRAIEGSFAAAEQIRAHREERSAGEVFQEVQQIFGDVFICAGYLLGHVHGLESNLKDRTLRLSAVCQKNPAIETLMTKLERILHELWLHEFVWPSIEVFAPIYDLICDLMSQCGLVFVRHKDEWRIVMYEEQEAIEEARQALRRWTGLHEPQEE
ncbi:MAG: hypothetical protein ABI209_15200 [Edaphobacter sp.]